jgi:hypothetical protein
VQPTPKATVPTATPTPEFEAQTLGPIYDSIQDSAIRVELTEEGVQAQCLCSLFFLTRAAYAQSQSGCPLEASTVTDGQRELRTDVHFA